MDMPRMTVRAGFARLRRPPRWWLVGSLAAAALVIAAFVFWPKPTRPAEPPRARAYLQYTACLLTGERGVSDPVAGPVWAGLQDASLATHAKVQYLAIVGPQTVDNGLTFLNNLAQTNCDLIFAAGDTPLATVEKGAAKFPHTRFLPVGLVQPGTNITPIAGHTPEEVRAAVSTALTTAVAARPSSTS
jgi:hypothetical protein